MGIGAQVAAQLPREGHGITVFDIAQPTAPIDHPVETNFSNPRSVSAALKANGDRCDIAINNGGCHPETAGWKILQVNYVGLTLSPRRDAQPPVSRCFHRQHRIPRRGDVT